MGERIKLIHDESVSYEEGQHLSIGLFSTLDPARIADQIVLMEGDPHLDQIAKDEKIGVLYRALELRNSRQEP